MDSSESDDKFTIVNGSNEYLVSKKIICEIPYFKNLLSHSFSESKENKVRFDFDDQALKEVLNYIEFGYMLIKMETVIHLCNLIDYFGMDNNLKDDCVNFFHEKFTIEHIPVIIPQVTSTSLPINSGALDAFICRIFLKLINTKVWLNYPIETVDYILGLNLFINSEKKVFDAIIKYIDHDVKSRMRYLGKLLNNVCWYKMEAKDLEERERKYFLESAGLGLAIRQRKLNHDFTRDKFTYLLLIERIDNTTLNVKIHDHYEKPLFEREVKLDQSLPLDKVNNGNVSDMLFKCGKAGIRFDWSSNKYRELNFGTLNHTNFACFLPLPSILSCSECDPGSLYPSLLHDIEDFFKTECTESLQEMM